VALNYVTLILDGFDGSGTQLTRGTATFTPSVLLTDPTDQEWIPPAPVSAEWRNGLAAPQVRLLATDNANVLPAGWGWKVSFLNVPGTPAPFNFFLPFSGGATQRLSQLQPVQSVTAMQAYMPLPSGTAQAGQVPVASGVSSSSAWTTLPSIPIPAPSGGPDAWPAIQAALNAAGTVASWSSGQGVVAVLSPGVYVLSRTLIIPSGVRLAGSGIQVSYLTLQAGANCDVIQFEQYNSASQAAILGVPAASLINAFYAGVQDLTVHGDLSASASPTGYFHGINATTNPLVTAAGGDPDFDPFNQLTRVEARFCTGDGFFMNGRSGLRVTDCLSRYNLGNGFTPSFDTLFSSIESGFNGVCGVYMNHGSTSGDGKIYNNGTIAPWISGHSYTVSNRVMSAGIMYGCILATSGTTAPASDPTHWTAITATSIAAFGYDLYLDSNCSENRWAIDSQEPTAGNVYIKGAIGCTVTGVCNRPNFDNPTTGAQLGTNPNNLAVVTLDGAIGCNVSLSYNVLNTACYGIKAINSSSKNSVILTGDASWQAIQAPGSSLTGNFVVVDGATQSGGGTSGMAQVAATPAAGFTLANSTLTAISWTAPSDGNLHTAIITAMLEVASNETGGLIAVDFQYPDNTTQTFTLFSSGLTTTGGSGGSGRYGYPTDTTTGLQHLLTVYPGGTVRIYQYNALTAGAATLWATIVAT
jgi:hypothetical protein